MDDDAGDTDLNQKKVVAFPKKSKRAASTPPVGTTPADDDQPTPDPDVVEYLSILLERAKRGEIQAFGFAGVTPDYVAIHSFHAGRGDERSTLMAAVAYLSHGLAAECLSDTYTMSDCDPEDGSPEDGTS